MSEPIPAAETVLFGAFDRHNFGDLLFAHIAERMLPGRRLRFAGLAQVDLSRYGGHKVEAVSTLARSCADRPVDIVHAGGELLTCNAWEAAVMLASADHAKAVIGQRAAWRSAPLEWADHHLGIRAWAPYVVPRERFAQTRVLAFNAVGGVDLDECEPGMLAQVIETLASASDVTVRDVVTQQALDASGIAARLLPDPAVMVEALFGDVIRARIASEPVASIRNACPNGYIAAQFSADFGDDRSVDEIASQLDMAAQSHGLGVAFFRAGIAPWHDDLAVFERARQRMRTASVHILSSPNLWDICALIAGSRVFCGSSLHGRIVAAAFALARVNLLHPVLTSAQSKQAAFAATWEDADMPGAVDITETAQAVSTALAIEQARHERIANRLVHTYREGFERLSALLA